MFVWVFLVVCMWELVVGQVICVAGQSMAAGLMLGPVWISDTQPSPVRNQIRLILIFNMKHPPKGVPKGQGQLLQITALLLSSE